MRKLGSVGAIYGRQWANGLLPLFACVYGDCGAIDGVIGWLLGNGDDHFIDGEKMVGRAVFEEGRKAVHFETVLGRL